MLELLVQNKLPTRPEFACPVDRMIMSMITAERRERMSIVIGRARDADKKADCATAHPR